MYLSSDIEVPGLGGYEAYRLKVPAVVAMHGRRYLARGGARPLRERTATWNRIAIDRTRFEEDAT